MVIQYIHVRGVAIVIPEMLLQQRDIVILQKLRRRPVQAKDMLHIPAQSVITVI